MAKRVAIGLVAICAAVVLFLAFRWYDRLPWLEASVRAHSERNSTNCGHLTNTGYANPDPDAVIHCIMSSHQQRRPFYVTFSFSGIDEQFNSGIVGDSKGQAIEIFYGVGMVERPNTLLRRRCDPFDKFIVQRESVYDIPQLHCRPWPPPALERDHIFW
jgi:hypothetical protein